MQHIYSARGSTVQDLSTHQGGKHLLAYCHAGAPVESNRSYFRYSGPATIDISIVPSLVESSSSTMTDYLRTIHSQLQSSTDAN